MAVQLVTSATLGELNVGLAVAVGFLNPLGAQIDALLALGIGPFEFDLAAQFNAALAAQASISLQISDPLAALNAAIAALASLQASLSAALSLPPLQLGLSAELGASAALAATLSAKLGGLTIAVSAALAIKIPAVQAAAALAASLSAGPIFLHQFTGDTLSGTMTEIGGFSSGMSDPGNPGNNILSADSVSGFLLTTKDPAAFAAMQAVFATP